MSFNPLKEKGTPIEKQIRNWHEIARRPFKEADIDCYTRTRQILMNGIEVECWNFKHNFSRISDDKEANNLVALTRRAEDMQQTTINWLAPSSQTVLETTLGYEQVAVELTAWLAQNEPDDYIRETFNFGLLEDFDHLYRYSQWAYLEDGISPNKILQGKTDVILGRPTQNHHNDSRLRIRNPYDKKTASAQSKVNILTLVSAEQQTHNYYAEHGLAYGNQCIRETYAEIKDVEEEHVTMYESLIDPTESIYEKLLIHEFTEVCNYYNCMKDEVDERLRGIWEMFLDYEIAHLKIAAELFQRREKRDAEEVIGDKVFMPCRFESQKEYVTNILENEIQKRLGANKNFIEIKDITEDWESFSVQEKLNEEGSPTEMTIQLMATAKGRDLVIANEKLKSKEASLLRKGLQPEPLAPDTIMPDELEILMEEDDIEHDCDEF